MILTDAVFGFISSVIPELEGKIIPWGLDMTSPKLPYCTFKVSSEKTYGMAEVTYEQGAAFAETVSEQKKAVVEINFYAAPLESNNDEDARFFNSLFTKRAKGFKGQDASDEFRIFLGDFKDYSNLDEYLGDKLESRSILELNIFFTDSLTEDARKVDSVSHTGTIVDHLGAPI